MVKFSDIIYYNLLVKAGIVVLILGVLVGILVFTFFMGFSKNIGEVKTSAFYGCRNDTDCFEWCGECRTMADTQVCDSKGLACKCIDNLCAAK